MSVSCSLYLTLEYPPLATLAVNFGSTDPPISTQLMTRLSPSTIIFIQLLATQLILFGVSGMITTCVLCLTLFRLDWPNV